MSEKFRLLISYDNSKFADAAIEDLRFAGLPEADVEALVIIVAKIWLPPADADPANTQGFLTEGLRKKLEKNLQILEDAKEIAANTAERVAGMFPGWTVEPHATYGSPAWEILSRANKFKPDLIVAGSQGLSAFKRIWLGSVSQKLVAEADCSVRVARRSSDADSSAEKGPEDVRLVIGFDGTDGAERAVASVRRRVWKPGTRIRVVIAEDYEVDRQAFSGEETVSKLEKRGAEIVSEFEQMGLEASLEISEDDPKDVILQAAEDLSADCIFVGATKFASKMERLLIGSVSSAIAARANCSVEVVRPNYYQEEKN